MVQHYLKLFLCGVSYILGLYPGCNLLLHKVFIALDQVVPAGPGQVQGFDVRLVASFLTQQLVVVEFQQLVFNLFFVLPQLVVALGELVVQLKLA